MIRKSHPELCNTAIPKAPAGSVNSTPLEDSGPDNSGTNLPCSGTSVEGWSLDQRGYGLPSGSEELDFVCTCGGVAEGTHKWSAIAN
jgi:hypothetical protein